MDIMGQILLIILMVVISFKIGCVYGITEGIVISEFKNDKTKEKIAKIKTDYSRTYLSLAKNVSRKELNNGRETM